MKTIFPGRLGVQQRVLPSYRAPFFEALAASCAGGMSLFAGQPRPQEAIATTGRLETAHLVRADNLHLFGGPFYLCFQAGLPAWLNTWQPDALIVEANPRYLATPTAIRWMRRRGRPVIGWGLGSPAILGPLAGLRRSMRLRFLSRFDALVAYSRRGADEYAGLGFPPERIFVAQNAVTPRPSAPPPERADSVERATLLFVGRLQERKRLDLLLEACAALPAEQQPRLVIVGDGPARASLEALAAGTYPQAEFAGAVHGADLAPYFASADLFVLPGTGGLAVQEAMSFGLPVVVARGDGTQDDLVRPENGWQVPSDDFQALKAALQEALADLPRLRAMGKESYRIIREEVNLERMVGGMVEALNSLMKTSR